MTGQHHEATGLFEALLHRGSPLGLFSEEMDPFSGVLLGNFPQALTHSALVQAALALRDYPPPKPQQTAAPVRST